MAIRFNVLYNSCITVSSRSRRVVAWDELCFGTAVITAGCRGLDGDTATIDACEACGLCAPLTAVVAVEAKR
jgi:hypothetical protein